MRFKKLKSLFTFSARSKGQDGFSMLELSMVTGVFATFAVTGAISVTNLSNDDTKHNHTEKAAKMVFSGALTYHHDHDPLTVPETAATEYNESNLSHVDGSDKGKVFAEAEELTDGGIRVTATYVGADVASVIETSDAEAIESSPVVDDSDGGQGDDEGTPEEPVIVLPKNDVVKFKCDNPSNGEIVLVEVSDGSSVTVYGDDGSIFTHDYHDDSKYAIVGSNHHEKNDLSRFFSPNSGVEYVLSVSGDYTALKSWDNSKAKSMNSCSISFMN